MYSLGFGFLLGILYDVFRTIRLVISNSRGFVFFMDMLYFAVCAFASFCFIMVVDCGRVRIYAALGWILGWLIYYFSFGAIAIKVSGAVISAVRRFFAAIFAPISRISRKICRKIGSSARHGKKIIRKTDKKTKFILQKYKGIVYNLNSFIKNSVSRNKGSE